MTGSNAAQADAGRVRAWLAGSLATQILAVVTRLGLVGEWGPGVRDADELAKPMDIPPERMIRLLRAMAAMGLCAEVSAGRFELTGMGELLAEDKPGSLHGLVRLISDPVTQQPWLRLESSLRTGRAAFDEVFGAPVFEFFTGEAELAQIYNTAMSERSRSVARALPDAYEFDRFSEVVDVGGGDGTVLASVLRRHPGLRGVVFDRTAVVAQAAEAIAGDGLATRCGTSAGDFFEQVPTGGDLYLLKSIVHDWDDDRAAVILRRCHEALPPHGRLLIIEPVLPDVVRPETSEEPYFDDLHMLVLYGGKERTRSEFVQLCARAGLTVSRLIPLPGQAGYHVVETCPVWSTSV